MMPEIYLKGVKYPLKVKAQSAQARAHKLLDPKFYEAESVAKLVGCLLIKALILANIHHYFT